MDMEIKNRSAQALLFLIPHVFRQLELVHPVINFGRYSRRTPGRGAMSRPDVDLAR